MIGFSSLRRSSGFLTGLVDRVRLVILLRSRELEAKDCRSLVLSLAVNDMGGGKI